MTAEEVGLAFVAAINSGDANQLSAWMTEDHIFVDSDGSQHAGRESMRAGWGEYYAMVPDYQIEVSDLFSRDDTVVMVGHAEGTFSDSGILKPENHWRVPAAWRAVVAGKAVAVWQLYVNPEPMREILQRIQAARL